MVRFAFVEPRRAKLSKRIGYSRKFPRTGSFPFGSGRDTRATKFISLFASYVGLTERQLLPELLLPDLDEFLQFLFAEFHVRNVPYRYGGTRAVVHKEFAASVTFPRLLPCGGTAKLYA